MAKIDNQKLTIEDIDKALEESKKTEGFDLHAAEDTEGFYEFLSLYPDKEDVEHDPAKVQERFEIFNMKNDLIDEIKDVYHDEIMAETGIELSEEDLSDIDNFISSEAVENPAAIKLMNEQIEEYSQLPGQIEAAQKELESLTNNANEAAKGLGIFGTIKMYGGLAIGAVTGKITEGRGIYNAQQEMKKHGVPITPQGLRFRRIFLESQDKEIEGEFAKIQGDKTAKLNELSERLASVKKELFMHAGLREQITFIAREKVKQRIVDFSTGNGIISFDQAEDSIQANKYGETTGLEYLDTDSEQEVRETVDKKAEEYIKKVIESSIRDTALGQGARTRLEQSLIEVIDARSAGSKDRRQVGEFVVKTMREVASKLPNDYENNPKRVRANLLAQRLASHYQSEPEMVAVNE